MAKPTEALASFAKRIHEDFEVWYERHERLFRFWYIGLQLFAFVVSILTAILAALADAEAFKNWAKYILVLLPVLGSIAISLITQLRLYDLWKLREEGRIQFQNLAIEAERRAAAAKTDEEATKIHEDIQKQLNEIESAQNVGFFGLFRSDFILQHKKS
jgi:hypothetical protein